MAGLNKIILIGRLGTEPEPRSTPNGTSTTRFRMAVSRTYTAADGERREETEWFTVKAFGRLADTCNNYLRKGMQIYIEGRLATRTWQGQDGKDRFELEVTANEMQMLESRRAMEEGGYDSAPAPAPARSGGGSRGNERPSGNRGGDDWDDGFDEGGTSVDELPF